MKKSRRKHPVLFQGIRQKKAYFEGWYYKAVNETQETAIALIPGISLDQKDPHAFIQVFVTSATSLQTVYFRFPVEDFSYEDEPFRILIKHNEFSLSQCTIDLTSEELTIQGTLQIHTITPLKTSLYAPNIMGPFAYFPYMECSHGVISMNHAISGTLTLNNTPITFDHGKGYIEKDWGTSFPKEYVWLQSNHFRLSNASFMFSYASIPFFKSTFNGLICVLILHNIEYRFSTYQLGKILREDIFDNEVFYTLKKGNKAYIGKKNRPKILITNKISWCVPFN